MLQSNFLTANPIAYLLVRPTFNQSEGVYIYKNIITKSEIKEKLKRETDCLNDNNIPHIYGPDRPLRGN